MSHLISTLRTTVSGAAHTVGGSDYDSAEMERFMVIRQVEEGD